MPDNDIKRITAHTAHIRAVHVAYQALLDDIDSDGPAGEDEYRPGSSERGEYDAQARHAGGVL